MEEQQSKELNGTLAEAAAMTFVEQSKKAADEAYKAQLAYITGNFDAYLESRFNEASQRLNDEYDKLGGARAEPEPEPEPSSEPIETQPSGEEA